MDVLSSAEIRKQRQVKGMSQARLANLCGVTRNTISRLERGVTDSFELRYRATNALRLVPYSLRGLS